MNSLSLEMLNIEIVSHLIFCRDTWEDKEGGQALSNKDNEWELYG